MKTVELRFEQEVAEVAEKFEPANFFLWNLLYYLCCLLFNVGNSFSPFVAFY